MSDPFSLQVEQIPLDVIAFSPYGLPAQSYYVELAPATKVGDAPDKARRLRRICTTRDGELADTFSGDKAFDLTKPESPWTHFVLADELAHGAASAGELFKQLMTIWMRPDEAAGTSALDPLHQRERAYGEKKDVAGLPTTRPRLSTGVMYRIKSDWGFPYTLVGDADTQLYPFGLSESKVRGKPVKATWNKARLVRFRKAADFDKDSRPFFETEIVNEYGNVLQTLKPPRTDAVVLPQRLASRPRLVLPNSDGFVLLHKHWTYQLLAYRRYLQYRNALEFLQRDQQLVSHLDHLLELSSRSITTDGECRAQCKAAMALVSGYADKVAKARTDVDAAYKKFERPAAATKGGAKKAGGALHYLVAFEGTKQFQDAYAKRWKHFPHFLGPGTFLVCAAWLIRQTPLHGDYFKTIRAHLFKLPPDFKGSRDPKQDAMGLDPRFVPSDPAFDAQGFLGWTQSGFKFATQSLSIRATICELYTYHIASSLYPTTTLLDRAVLAPKPSAADLERFIGFLSGDKAAAREVLAGRYTWSGKPLTQDKLKESIAKVGFDKRDKYTHIAKFLDGLSLALGLVALAADLHAQAHAKGPDKKPWLEVAGKALADGLGLAEGAAKLLGAAEKGTLLKILGPVAASAGAGFDLHTAAQSYLDGKDFETTTSTLKAVGGALCLAATYTSAIPVAGLPLSGILVIVGTLISIGAVVADYVEKHVNEAWENVAKQIYAVLVKGQGNKPAYHQGAKATLVINGKQRTVTVEIGMGPFAGRIKTYYAERTSAETAANKIAVELWEKKKSEITPMDKARSRQSLEWLLNDDDTWDGFEDGPHACEPRWRHLEGPKEKRAAWKARYEAYCKKLDPKWKAGDPPPKLPNTRPVERRA